MVTVRPHTARRQFIFDSAKMASGVGMLRLGLRRVILSEQCTNCGRCIDVCTKDFFAFGSRFHNPLAPPPGVFLTFEEERLP